MAQDAHTGEIGDPPSYACISLWNPWAMLIPLLAKRIETRSWHTPYRGWIAIHATKKTPPDALAIWREEPFRTALAPLPRRTMLPGIQAITPEFPEGAIVAVAVMANCVRIASDEHAAVLQHRYGATHEAAFGDYRQGRYAWILSQISAVWPAIPASGGRGIWQWTPPTSRDRDRIREMAGGRAPLGNLPILTGVPG